MQVFKDRDPKWIKLDRDILDSYEFDTLADASKYHVIALRLLAAKLDNKIPKDSEWIQSKIGAKEPVDLQALEDAGFIVPWDGSESLVQIRTDLYVEKRREEKSIEKKKKAYSEEFLSFWKAYPRKEGKGAAFRAWEKACLPALEKVIAAVEIQSKTEQWTKEHGQFIPHPATWLNAARWDDEVVDPTDPAASIDYDESDVMEAVKGLW